MAQRIIAENMIRHGLGYGTVNWTTGHIKMLICFNCRASMTAALYSMCAVCSYDPNHHFPLKGNIDGGQTT